MGVREKGRSSMIRQIIFTILMLAFTSPALSSDAFNPENIKISIEHGVEVYNKRPGFNLTIENWLPEEKILIFAISPSGEKIQLDKDSVYADKSGLCVLGIDYEVKGFYQGTWVLVVAGEAGFHYLTLKLPKVTPPSETNKNWVVDFGGANKQKAGSE